MKSIPDIFMNFKARGNLSLSFKVHSVTLLKYLCRNFYKQQTAIGIIEIGRRLIEAKEQLPHGEWGTWLKEKVEFSQMTANRFMNVASEFSNSTAMLNLGQSKIFMLLDLPQTERDKFVSTSHEVNGETKTVDDMTTRELQKVIKLMNFLLILALFLYIFINNIVNNINKNVDRIDAHV